MSLIKCEKCGKNISDKSIKCVNCGYRLNKGKFNYLIFTVLICLMVIVLTVVLKFFINDKNDDVNNNKYDENYVFANN